MEQGLYLASIWVIPALLAITLHEAAHGYAAEFFGDDTARRLGRISLNPFRHVDPFGTVLMPAMLLIAGAPFLFGYAKPVPVNFGRLNTPRRDMIFVAAAGPAMNLALALAAAFLYHGVSLLPPGVAAWAGLNLINAIQLNVVLAVFNMLPIPPLDGGRVAVGLLPNVLAYPLARLERIGIFIVLGLMLLPRLLPASVAGQFDLFDLIVLAPAEAVINLIVTIAGLR